MMLLTASKAYVRHPELAAAKANRDFVLRQVNLSPYQLRLF
jgi:catenin alpha